MQTDPAGLDAHEQPSDELRGIWKTFSKTDQNEILSSGSIDDLATPQTSAGFRQAGSVPSATLRTAFADLLQSSEQDIHVEHDATIHYHPVLPG